MSDTIRTTAEIRSLNKKKILQYVTAHPEQTRKQIADGLDLSFATVSNLVAQLSEEDILRTESSEQSHGGRIPGLITVNKDACCTLCVDLARKEKIGLSVVNLRGESIARTALQDLGGASYEEVLSICHRESLALLDSVPLPLDRLIGVSVSVPGIIDLRDGVIVNSTYERLEGKPLRADLEALFSPLPCQIGNEANLTALGILQSVRESGMHSILFLYIDEGLGIGVISDEKLLVGSHGFGGEISHWQFSDMRGYPCYCGKRGCLETELSKSGFIKKLNENQGAQRAGSWEGFVSLVKGKDPAAIEVLQENGQLIARLISSLQMLLDPQACWLGGGICEIFSEIRPFIKTYFDAYGQRFPAIPISCVSDSHMMAETGCAKLAFDRWMP